MFKRMTYILAVGTLLAILVSCLLLARRMFVIGLNPFPGSIFVLLLLLLAIPVVIWGSRKFKMSVWELFAIGAVCWTVMVLTRQLFSGRSTIDIQLHDTYYVVSRNYLWWPLIIFMAWVAWGYYLLEQKGSVNKTWGRIHFWITFPGCLWVFRPAPYWPAPYVGLAGMPRRYVDYSTHIPVNSSAWYWPWPIAIIGIMVIAQLVFVGVMLYHTTGKFFKRTNN